MGSASGSPRHARARAAAPGAVPCAGSGSSSSPFRPHAPSGLTCFPHSGWCRTDAGTSVRHLLLGCLQVPAHRCPPTGAHPQVPAPMCPPQMLAGHCVSHDRSCRALSYLNSLWPQSSQGITSTPSIRKRGPAQHTGRGQMGQVSPSSVCQTSAVAVGVLALQSSWDWHCCWSFPGASREVVLNLPKVPHVVVTPTISYFPCYFITVSLLLL